jgi:hypothetical protein
MQRLAVVADVVKHGASDERALTITTQHDYPLSLRLNQ